ncbi:tyrosine-type recombinase/integrase [uncultured Desulfovibrio sp.]|uniref:tyrosine-type recombinase/integrase n=1 Tax=uncultured Desulfovibrio sp. TaxID=167968 RepID=UPI002804178E|nr:tyrosine-type recombinase/integrase [uncultured Desulfovibrio sp.]
MHRHDPKSKLSRKTKDGQLTLDVFVSRIYLPNIKVRKRSWQIDERIARQYLSPVFGHRVLSEIARCEVEDWLSGLLERGLAPSSCNRFLAVFKTICSFAEARSFLDPGTSPCNGVSSFRLHAQRERYLSQSEAQQLAKRLEQSNRPEALALRLLLLTGARKSEILKAQWENVSFEQRLLTVPLSKSGKPRHIVLSDAAIAVIRAIPRKAGISWLFPGHAEGKPLSDLYLFWKKLRNELGLNALRIHDLRHTFASFLVNSGHSLYEVQKMLGHADPRTTMRYAHLGQASLLAAAEMVGNLVRNQANIETHYTSATTL